jgi:hypothetical protein
VGAGGKGNVQESRAVPRAIPCQNATERSEVTLGNGGAAYGNSNAPAYPGSGSGTTYGGIGRAGGGLVRLEIEKRLVVDGTITVDGQFGYNRGGGGSGGGVWLTCKTFEGNGAITANGGAGDTVYAAGPGAGGRIAVWGLHQRGSVTMVATNGVQNLGTGPAEAGTVVWYQLQTPGTLLLLK